MSMQWITSLRSDSAPGSRTSSPVGTGPRPSARVHRREVHEFHREVRAQQQNIEELTAALTAESEMALASHPATVADSPGSAASLLPDEPLRIDSLEAAIEALESRVMNMEAEAGPERAGLGERGGAAGRAEPCKIVGSGGEGSRSPRYRTLRGIRKNGARGNRAGYNK